MKRRLIIVILVLTFSIIFIVGIWNKLTSSSPQDIVNSKEEKWGIQLPLPDSWDELFTSGPSFHGDGEFVYVYHYSNLNNEMLDSGMIEIVENNLPIVNSRILKFISDTISMQDGHKAQIAFEKYPLEVQLGDLYYYKVKNGGNDYVIAVYKNEEQKLYIMEWHQ